MSNENRPMRWQDGALTEEQMRVPTVDELRAMIGYTAYVRTLGEVTVRGICHRYNPWDPQKVEVHVRGSREYIDSRALRIPRTPEVGSEWMHNGREWIVSAVSPSFSVGRVDADGCSWWLDIEQWHAAAASGELVPVAGANADKSNQADVGLLVHGLEHVGVLTQPAEMALVMRDGDVVLLVPLYGYAGETRRVLVQRGVLQAIRAGIKSGRAELMFRRDWEERRERQLQREPYTRVDKPRTESFDGERGGTWMPPPPAVTATEQPAAALALLEFSIVGKDVGGIPMKTGPIPSANSRWTRNDGTSWRVIDTTAYRVTAVCGSDYQTFSAATFAAEFTVQQEATARAPTVTDLERAIREEAKRPPDGVSEEAWLRELLRVVEKPSFPVWLDTSEEETIALLHKWATKRRGGGLLPMIVSAGNRTPWLNPAPRYGRAKPPTEEQRAEWRAKDAERAERVRRETVAMMREAKR